MIPGVAFIATVIFKLFFFKLTTWKWKFDSALWSWWMPSAHSAVMTSLATAIAIKYWTNSDLFAITITITVITIYDAVNVRYQAWLHAKALNKLLDKNKYNESLGHLPSEAFAGWILWILVAIILYFV